MGSLIIDVNTLIVHAILLLVPWVHMGTIECKGLKMTRSCKIKLLLTSNIPKYPFPSSHTHTPSHTLPSHTLPHHSPFHTLPTHIPSHTLLLHTLPLILSPHTHSLPRALPSPSPSFTPTQPQRVSPVMTSTRKLSIWRQWSTSWREKGTKHDSISSMNFHHRCSKSPYLILRR